MCLGFSVIHTAVGMESSFASGLWCRGFVWRTLTVNRSLPSRGDCVSKVPVSVSSLGALQFAARRKDPKHLDRSLTRPSGYTDTGTNGGLRVQTCCHSGWVPAADIGSLSVLIRPTSSAEPQYAEGSHPVDSNAPHSFFLGLPGGHRDRYTGFVEGQISLSSLAPHFYMHSGLQRRQPHLTVMPLQCIRAHPPSSLRLRQSPPDLQSESMAPDQQ